MIEALALFAVVNFVVLFTPLFVSAARERAAWRLVVAANQERLARLEGRAANHPIREGKTR